MNGRGSAYLGDLLARGRVLGFLFAILASTGAAWFITHSDTRTLAVAAIGLLGTAALIRWPSLTVLSLLIICQELDPSGGFGGPSASGLLFLGHQLYFTTVGRISVLTLILLVATGRLLVTEPPQGRPRLAGVLLVVAMGIYYTARLWADGTSVSSAINQDSRYALLFGLCFVIGASANRSSDWSRYAVPVALAVISAMTLVGIYLAATGQGEADTGTTVIFYDSAMGAVAGAIALAAFFSPRSQRSRLIWLLAGTSLIVVILSSRRNVWAAMIVALLLGLIFTQNRMRLMLRLLAATAVAGAGAAALEPSVMSGIGHQLADIWGATQGTAADASVQGHLGDISVGWRAVEASPISGVGPDGHVLGLVVEGSGPLYIHNQILESWLRFGLIGAALVVALQGMLMVQAVRALRVPTIDFSTRWAAILLLMAPVAMLTAPFLTTTQRWPAILGLAAGLVASATSAGSPGG